MKARELSGVARDLHTLCDNGAIGGLTDGHLLDRYVDERDDAAFAMLIERHGSMVWGVCRRVTGNRHDAEDVFQATFLVLAMRAASIVPREMVPNWLYGVAWRTAMKARAVASRRQGKEKHMVVMPEVEVSADAAGRSAAVARSRIESLTRPVSLANHPMRAGRPDLSRSRTPARVPHRHTRGPSIEGQIASREAITPSWRRRFGWRTQSDARTGVGCGRYAGLIGKGGSRGCASLQGRVIRGSRTDLEASDGARTTNNLARPAQDRRGVLGITGCSGFNNGAARASPVNGSASHRNRDVEDERAASAGCHKANPEAGGWPDSHGANGG